MKLAKLILALAMLAAITVTAQTVSVSTTYTWTAPTTGSVVHHYDVQQSVNGTTWTDRVEKPTTASLVITAAVGVPIQIRVRGVDALSRAGVWSDPSDAWTPDAGVPGACGKPSRS
jgi:hypothetical protein